GLDLVLARSRRNDDPSVADVIGGRLGREVLDRLVDPLIGGINAGRSDRLSLAAVAPDLAAAARRHRSLILGLRADRRAAPPSHASSTAFGTRRWRSPPSPTGAKTSGTPSTAAASSSPASTAAS